MEDLEDRGTLDETLVVVMSDMGRTPKINKNAGRDHWTFCYSVMFPVQASAAAPSTEPPMARRPT